LHGITVVVETTGESLYIGRYHEETPAGLVLHDVAEHRSPADAPSRAEFVRSTLEFGIRANFENLVVPVSQVVRITKLREWES
jgi:hypothetical protein